MNQNSKILVLGGNGLVGSALVRRLRKDGYENVLAPRRSELNLLSQSSTLDYFEKMKPEYVFLAAAKVGGIFANNTYRADFIFENLQIQNHTFEASFKNKVKRLLFLGSSCIYPKNAPQPLKESCLLTSPLEETNEPYAIAKIAGLKTAESFRRQYGCEYYSVMPTNLYGESDNFHLENSHVIPGLIARMQIAKENKMPEFKVWGSGKPLREFLYIDDMAEACIHVMKLETPIPDLINIGSGEEISIFDLAHLIKEIIGYNGSISFDPSKPDGTMRKLMDNSLIKSLGWSPQHNLKQGLEKTIAFYLNSLKK